MIGVGLSITSYYVFKAYALALEDFMVAYLLAIGLIIIFSLLTYVKFLKRHIKLAVSLIVLVSFVSSLALWISTDEFTGLSFYFLNVSYFYLIAIMSKNEDKKELMREMSIVSFGAFFIVSFFVLVILTEGDALQLLDGTDGMFFSPRKKKV
jgi:4-amino-4-deoxy-L-arabinose transferase-like glycosyltransferase